MNIFDHVTSLVFGSPSVTKSVENPSHDEMAANFHEQSDYERERETEMFEEDRHYSDPESDEDIRYTVDGARYETDRDDQGYEVSEHHHVDTTRPTTVSYSVSGLTRYDDRSRPAEDRHRHSDTATSHHRSHREGRNDTWMGPAHESRSDRRGEHGSGIRSSRSRHHRHGGEYTGYTSEPSVYMRPGSRPGEDTRAPSPHYSYKSTPRPGRSATEPPPGILTSAIGGRYKYRAGPTPPERRDRDFNSYTGIDPSVATAMNILRQGKIWDPKFFEGKDWNEYKIHFTSCKDLNGWDDQEALKVLLTRLSGSATYVIAQRRASSWTYDSLIDALDTHYDNKRPEFLVKTKLKRMKQLPGESVADFAVKLYELGLGKFETQEQEDYELLDAFTYNVADKKIMKAIVKQRPRIRTIQEALALAKEKEDCNEWLDTERPTFRAHSKTVLPSSTDEVKEQKGSDLTTATTAKQGDDSLYKHIAAMEQKMKVMAEQLATAQAAAINSSSAQYHSRSGQGNYQGHQGHGDNREGYNNSGYKPRLPGGSTTVTCYYCGYRGHIRRDCRKRMREEGRGSSDHNQRGGRNDGAPPGNQSTPAMVQMHRLQPRNALNPGHCA